VGRRRGEIEAMLRRCVYGGRCPGDVILVVDREAARGVAEVPLSRVKRVTSTHMILDDDTFIPLHRVLGIADENGEVRWRRGSSRGRPRGGSCR